MRDGQSDAALWNLMQLPPKAGRCLYQAVLRPVSTTPLPPSWLQEAEFAGNGIADFGEADE
jgi:hypothetical protein